MTPKPSDSMTATDSYVICTSPRSGSTLLCDMLTSTGVAGRPASYFYAPSVAEWAADLELTFGPNATERDRLQAILGEVLHAGRNGTKVFGLRQQANGLAFLCQKLAVLFPDAATDVDRFACAFGSTSFIHLTREDKVRQAVSLHKAEQSGLWHVAEDGRELERTAPHAEPVYDCAGIAANVDRLTGQDRAWDLWFAQHGITPLRLTYQALADDHLGVLRTVLEHVGLNPSAVHGVRPGVRRLSDHVTETWVTRFHADSDRA